MESQPNQLGACVLHPGRGAVFLATCAEVPVCGACYELYAEETRAALRRFSHSVNLDVTLWESGKVEIVPTDELGRPFCDALIAAKRRREIEAANDTAMVRELRRVIVDGL